MQDLYKTQATEQVQLLRTGQVCDAWTQHGGEPTAHPRSSRRSTIAVEAARVQRWLHNQRGLPPKHSLLCAAPHKPIKKTSAQCKISSKHKQQSKFSFYKRDKCAMHGRSMEGSRRLIHEAAEALRLPKLSCRTRSESSGGKSRWL